MLLHERWLRRPAANLSVLPCGLVSRNGDTLRRTVVELGHAWRLPAAFFAYLDLHVVWANSLVDRIVSEPLPLLDAIVLTDHLDTSERLKLCLLNLGHTLLAEWWQQEMRPANMAVLEALRDRLLNPFLAHRLSDMAQHHIQMKHRRLAPLIALVEVQTRNLAQHRLRAAMSNSS